jgi:hypothetical protein
MGSRLGTGWKRRYAKATQQQQHQGSECDISRSLSSTSLHEYACEGRHIACSRTTGAVPPRCIVCPHFVKNVSALGQQTVHATVS